jgi:hypothetical protein
VGTMLLSISSRDSYASIDICSVKGDDYGWIHACTCACDRVHASDHVCLHSVRDRICVAYGYAHGYIRTHGYMHVSECMRMSDVRDYVWIHAGMHASECMYAHGHMHIHMDTCMHGHVQVCMRPNVCMPGVCT